MTPFLVESKHGIPKLKKPDFCKIMRFSVTKIFRQNTTYFEA